MRLHDANKYIKESYQDILKESNQEVSFIDQLKSDLQQAVDQNIDSDYYTTIIDMLNKYYPDKDWYEVTSIDIPNELYRYDVNTVINHIIDNLKIEVDDTLTEDFISKVTNFGNKIGNKIISGTQSAMKAMNAYNNAGKQQTSNNTTSASNVVNTSNNDQVTNGNNVEYKSNDPIWMLYYDDGGKLSTVYTPGSDANKAIANAKAGGVIANNTRVKKIEKVKDRINKADQMRKKAKSFLNNDGMLAPEEWAQLQENKFIEENTRKEFNTFKTKKQADVQRRAMYANRYKGESMQAHEELTEDWSKGIFIKQEFPLDKIEETLKNGSLEIPAFVDGEWEDTSSLKVYGFSDSYANVYPTKNIFELNTNIYDRDISSWIDKGLIIFNKVIRLKDKNLAKEAVEPILDELDYLISVKNMPIPSKTTILFKNADDSLSLEESMSDDAKSIGIGYTAPIIVNRKYEIKSLVKEIHDPDHGKFALKSAIRIYHQIIDDMGKIEEFDNYWEVHKKALMSELKEQLDMLPEEAKDFDNDSIQEAANPENAEVNKLIHDVATGDSKAYKKLQKMGYVLNAKDDKTIKHIMKSSRYGTGKANASEKDFDYKGFLDKETPDLSDHIGDTVAQFKKDKQFMKDNENIKKQLDAADDRLNSIRNKYNLTKGK